MAISVKVLISAVSATSVILVAVITLSIALVTGLSAIRSLGTKHAAVLRTVADIKTVAMFASGTDSHIQIINATKYNDWGQPSENRTNATELYASLQRVTVLQSPVTIEQRIYFKDNSKIGFTVGTTLYSLMLQHASAMSDYPNQTLWSESITFRLSDHQLSTRPASDPEVQYQHLASARETYAHRRPGANSLYTNFIGLTRGGTQSATTSPLLAPAWNDNYAAEPHGSFVFPLVSPLVPLLPEGHVFNVTEDAIGFFVSSIRFSQIDEFLREVRSTANTAAFVYDQDTFLIGTSVEDVPAVRPDTVIRNSGCSNTYDYPYIRRELLCRVPAAEYGHAALADFATTHPDLLQPSEPVVERFNIGDGAHYVAVGPVQFAFVGAEMHLALLMPEADVIGDVVRGRNIAIGIAAALVLLLAAANFVLVMTALSPLDRIAERMMKAANLEDDGVRERVSTLAEVARLQEAYYAMNDELNRIRSYVPQTVLYARRGEAAEEEDEDIEETIEIESTSPNNSTMRRGSSARSGLGSSGGGKAGSAGGPTPRGGLSRRTSSRLPSSRLPPAAGVSDGSSVSSHLTGGLISLRRAQVTVVAANIEGLHAALVGSQGPQRTAEALGVAVGLAEEAVVSRHGVMTFHGDRFYATFNAARVCGGHGRRGIEAALAMALQVDGQQPGGLRLRCGVATSFSTVGSVGSDKMKAFSTLGVAFTHAVLMEKLSRRYGAGCRVLSTAQTATEAQGRCHARFVDLVALKGVTDVRPALVAAVIPGVTQEQENDEWLYVVGAANGTKSAEGDRHAAFEALKDGSVTHLWMEADTLEQTADDKANAFAYAPWGSITDALPAVMGNARRVLRETQRYSPPGVNAGSPLETLQPSYFVPPDRMLGICSPV